MQGHWIDKYKFRKIKLMFITFNAKTNRWELTGFPNGVFCDENQYFYLVNKEKFGPFKNIEIAKANYLEHLIEIGSF